MKSDVISLAKEFFGGDDSFLDLKAKIIYLDESEGIINQYIMFCNIYKDYYAIFGGDKEKALKETIKTCENDDILREYLENRKGELTNLSIEEIQALV